MDKDDKLKQLEMQVQQLQDRDADFRDDEIDLRELFKALWKGKWIVIITTFIFSIISVFYALSLPDIYKSESLLSPVEKKNAMQLPGGLGGIAAMAGMNLGGGEGNKSAIALEILQSRKFLSQFIKKHDLLVKVMAVDGWDISTDTFSYDEALYDKNKNKWIREVSPPKAPVPSFLEAQQVFKKEFLSVLKSEESGLITIGVSYYHPEVARRWVELLVRDIDDLMRERELERSQRSIDYLYSQIEQTQLADVKTALYSLVEEQTKSLMMAKVNKEFVFNVIDPPIIPEKHSQPNRALICVLGAMLGGFIACLFVLVSYFFKSES